MPRWAVGVGVNLKIFDGLNREYKYSAAKQTVKQVEVLEMKAGKDIAVLIEKLYNQMNNYANQMKSIDASLAFAEEYLKAKNAAFLEGMSSSSDLVDAELNLAKCAPSVCRPPTITMSHWPSCSKPPASAMSSSATCTVPTPVPFISTKSKYR